MTTSKDPTAAIRAAAGKLAGGDAGEACNQSAYKAGKGTFLFIGPGAKGVGYKAMFKLGPSLSQAATLAERHPERFEAGKTGWATARFTTEEPLPKTIWAPWLAESFELTRGGGATAKSSGASKAAKKSGGTKGGRAGRSKRTSK